VGTGIGGVGFFIFVGGALILARFRGAGLPALTSLSVVPRAQLLAIGATALTVLLVIGLAVVILLAALWPRIRSSRVRLAILCVAGLVGLVAYVGRVGPAFLTSTEHGVLMVAGVLVATAGVALTYTLGERGLADSRRTGDRARLVWFAIAAFVSSALFTGMGAYARQLNHPEVQAAAVLRGDDAPPLVGVFVGETGGSNSPNPNRVYIGLLSPGQAPGTGRLIAVQSPTVTAIAIGPAEPVRTAIARGPRLLQELREEASGGSEGPP
jgi:hypothetical protein